MKTLSRSAFAQFMLLAFLIAGCGGEKRGASDPSSQPARIVPVEVATASRQKLLVSRSYSGSFEGEDQANIVAKLSERVTALPVHVGTAVQAGQTIISLDKSGTTSQYYQAEAAYKNADKTAQRMTSLFAEGAISAQTLDGAKTAYDVARANFEAARSAVELTTPIAGVVTAININVGELSTPGTVLSTVARIDRMKITFNMNETDVANIKVGQKVVVASEMNPAARTTGAITQISKSADVRSRSFEIKVLFPNTADHWYKPGTFGTATVEVSPEGTPVVLPNAAIQSDGTTSNVFVIRNGTAHPQTVITGVSNGDATAILQGVNPGDTVATVGANALKEGTVVSIVSR